MRLVSRYWQLPVQSYQAVDWDKQVPMVWQVPVVMGKWLPEYVLERKNLPGNYHLPTWYHKSRYEYRQFWPGTELPDFELPGFGRLDTGPPGTD